MKGTPTKESKMLAREALGLPRIISKNEWIETLEKARLFALNKRVPPWLPCWLGFACVFGKRRAEISRLKWSDLWIENKHLFTKFIVGKKKSKSSPIDAKTYVKTKTLKHYAMPYILEWILNPKGKIKEMSPLQHIEGRFEPNQNSYKFLFPALPKRTSQQPNKDTVTIPRTFINGKGETVQKNYTYKIEAVKEGYVRLTDVNYYAKKVNPNIWLHLARTTVGTKAAETGASQFDIANILDVAPRTAVAYAEHGTAKTKAWNEEED